MIFFEYQKNKGAKFLQVWINISELSILVVIEFLIRQSILWRAYLNYWLNIFEVISNVLLIPILSWPGKQNSL